MKTGSTYKDSFLAMAEEYRLLLAREGEALLQRVVREKSVRDVLGTVYTILKDAGRLVPLEEFPVAEKLELWQEVVRLLPGESQQIRVEACKAVAALSCWVQIRMDELENIDQPAPGPLKP